MKKTILDVPFVSQYSVERDIDGLSRTCGLACVNKIIDFATGENISLGDLVAEGKMVKGAYEPGIGWNHKALVAMLRNHNVGAYSEEFKAVFNDIKSGEVKDSPYLNDHLDRGIRKIAKEVEEGRPVIVSGIKGWKEEDKPHMMLVLGFETLDGSISGFYYHDPDDENIDGRNNFIDVTTFRNKWRRFAIFLSL